MSKKKVLFWSVFAAVITALALPKIFSSKDAGMQQRGPSNQPIRITTHTTALQEVSNVLQVVGSLLADEEVQLMPEIQGRVVAIQFEEGAHAKKGDLLLKLHDAEYKAQYQRLQASLNLKKETEQRNKNLLEKGAISQETYDLSFTDLQMNEAELAVVQEQINKTEIRAPFDGKVGLRRISLGQIISPGTVICSIQKIDKLKIDFSIPDKYSSWIKTGQSVAFTVDGMKDTFEARVMAIEPKIDETTRNMQVRAMVNNLQYKLYPGTFVRVSFNAIDKHDAVFVPTQSIVPVFKGQKLYVVSGDSVLERKVKTGTRNEAMVEITEGLSAGEEVVVGGVIYMRQGTKITRQ
jgi:membrane fusion protein (multidrug efflux system)